MKEMNTKKVVKQFIDAANAFDLEAVLLLFAEDAVIDDVSVGDKFMGIKGVRKYMEQFFVGYKTVTKLVSVQLVDNHNVKAQVDFTGNFGHETGELAFVLNTNGKIVALNAHLD